MSRAAHILNLSREVTGKKGDKGVKRKLFNSASGPNGSHESASMDKVSDWLENCMAGNEKRLKLPSVSTLPTHASWSGLVAHEK